MCALVGAFAGAGYERTGESGGGVAVFAPQLTIHVAAPAVVAPAVAAVAPSRVAADHPSCPPPRRDAPWVAPHLAEPVTAVQPAPTNAGWIAAWNDHHVFVSYDAGASFERALDGDDAVADATFDCFGHLVVLRGSRVGVRDGGRELWRDASRLGGRAATPRAVLGGGPDLVVVGVHELAAGDNLGAQVAVSADLGARWTAYEAGPTYEDGSRLTGRERGDGSISLAIKTADCMNDDLLSVRIRDGKVDAETTAIAETASFAAYGELVVTDSAYRSDATSPWRELPLPASDQPVVVVPGAFPVVVAGGHAYRLVDGLARDLHLVVEGAPQAVDLAGRLWSIACGAPVVAKATATGAAMACAAGD